MDYLFFCAQGLVSVVGAALMVAYALRPATVPPPAQHPLLQQVGDYPLPGRMTRWDYMTT